MGLCKKKKTINTQEPGEYGRKWIWTAIDTTTRLIFCFLIGDRTLEDAHIFLKDLVSRTEELPLFTSDELPHYADGLKELFHKLEQPEPTEIVEQPEPEPPPPQASEISEEPAILASPMKMKAESTLEQIDAIEIPKSLQTTDEEGRQKIREIEKALKKARKIEKALKKEKKRRK